ncbi:MAG: polysaccharide deacetylase family protein [Ferruginibacter sp.]
MLNFRNTNIFFIVLLVIAIGLNKSAGIPFFVYPVLLLIYSGIVFYGCYFVDSNFFLPVICSAKTDMKEIAISFDDGPVNQYTPETLQVLKAHGVKAAFFCIGSRIGENEKLFRQLHEEGHVIGNHSFSHGFWFDLFSYKKMLEDLKRMDQEMERVTGLQPKLFRPPYGVTNPNLKKAIINGGYVPIGWSVRSMDTMMKDEKALFDKISKSLKPGAVFLFHDTSKTTLAILPSFIKWVWENGYEIVRLDKMLHLKPYA